MNSPVYLTKLIWALGVILLILVIYYLINIGNNYVPERKKLKFNDKKILPLVLGFVFIVLFFSLLRRFTILSDTFYTIILSAILAYLFNPIINYLEQKKISRMKGVLILYFTILTGLLIFLFLVIPKSSDEIKKLALNMPIYVENATEIVNDLYNRYYYTLGDLPPLFHGIQQVVMENIVRIEGIVVNGVKSFLGGIIKTFSKVISLILTPILTFYFLVDKNYFTGRLLDLIPSKYREESKELFYQMDVALSKFVRGKIILAAYVGVATSITLLIMGIDFALVIGFVTGVADIVPYVGPFLGFLPAVFFASISSPIKALWVAIIFVLIQWVENNILAPKILGDNTGIHPLIVLISIIIGGGIFGVLGMILAVPAVAIATILFSFIRKKLRRPPRIEN